MHLCADFHAGPSKEYLIFFLLANIPWLLEAHRIGLSARFDSGSERKFLLSIKINRANFHGNMINQNEAFEKTLSLPLEIAEIWANSLEKSLVCVILRERHLEVLFENRWTVFSHEFQSIIARIHAKNNENLSALAASSSRELRHVNTRKHIWRLQTVILNISVIQTNGDFGQDLPHFPGF